MENATFDAAGIARSTYAAHDHHDHFSDSGVSLSLRSTASSGDERSGSRSSALSSNSDEAVPSISHRTALFVEHPATIAQKAQAGGATAPAASGGVWRNPAVNEIELRHLGLMSHQTAPTSAQSGQPQQQQQSIPTSASLYPAPTLISQHSAAAAAARTLHLAPNLYAPHSHHIPEMLWKSPYNLPPGSIPSSHLISPGGHHPEDLIERERALMQERHNERIVSSFRERQNMEVREMEKREKERVEREKHEKMEREREEKERQEQALQNHFEKSLRQAAQQKREQWNPITAGRPSQQQQPPQRNEEVDRKVQQQQDLRDQRHLISSRYDTKDSRYHGNVQPQQQRMKNEYHPPPPAHSSRKEKLSLHPSKPSAGELNMFGYPAYHPQNAFAFAPSSQTHEKTGKKSVSESLQQSVPSSMMSEMKNSVIVKHVVGAGESKQNLHQHLEQQQRLSAQKMINQHHYMAPMAQKPANIYEYRSPSQSPHHQQHRQLSSPHQSRQSPQNSQQPPSGGAVIYPTNSPKSSSNYQFMSVSSAAQSSVNYSNSISKPKVSSPSPHHIYGKPPTGILAPVGSRDGVHGAGNSGGSLKLPPLPASVSPSPYQQVSQYHPPPPLVSTQLNNVPPPAHSRTNPSIERPYDRMYQGASVVSSGKPLHGTSPPIAAAAPRTHHHYISNIGNSSSVQTQPLDLGMSTKSQNVEQRLNDSPPKRKGGSTPPVLVIDNLTRSNSPQTSLNADVHAKKRRIESPFQISETVMKTAISSTPPPPMTQLAPPQPTVSNLCTINDNINDLCTVTPPNVVENLSNTNSAETQTQPTALRTLSESSTSTGGAGKANVPISGKESPSIKPNIAPSSVDSDKSNSPGPNKSGGSGNYPVRHLKKAWLQRHTGEDNLEDNTGAVGSGSCLTLPMNINNNNSNSNGTNSSTKEQKNEQNSVVNSLHSIGSMAVNSISKPKGLANNKTNNRKKENLINGQHADAGKGEDSSSSDQERGRKSPPKRKPPKVKRKKGGGGGNAAHKKSTNDETKKRKTSNTPILASESGSDSDKDTGSEKDSDSGASTTVSTKKGGAGKEPRKRGRRPKLSKNDKGDEPRTKKTKEDESSSVQRERDPFRKPPVGQLKKTGESFLQDGPCFEVAPKLAKCRECRWTQSQRSKNMPNIFCRFYAFRRLRYTKNGQLAIAGFSDPHKNSLEDDIRLWLPDPDNPPSDLDLETSRFLLKQVGDHFCDLLVQEKNAVNEHLSEDKTVAWKRVVQGVREMCDVCETTLFNYHWACGKCGFVVCLDCYRGRKNGTLKVWGEAGKDRDEFSWLLCTNRQAHEQEKLMLTQIIADNCLGKLGKMVHDLRELWNIEQFCGCPLAKDLKSGSGNNVKCKEIVKTILSEKLNGVKEIKEENSHSVEKPNGNLVKEEKDKEKTSPLSWLADVALGNEKQNNDETSSEDDDTNFSTLRELLIRPSHKQNGGSRANSPTNNSSNNSNSNSTKTGTGSGSAGGGGKKKKLDNLDEVLTSVIEENNSPNSANNEEEKSSGVDEEKCELKHFVRRYNWQVKGRVSLPIRIMTLTESKMLYPNVPHSWLCDGKLLRLSDPTHKENYKIFQDQWKRGQPVIVSDVSKLLNKDLWNPESFSRDFGDEKNDLVNCMTGNLVPNQPMRKFWDGFDHFNKRLKDDRGNPMLLKLKDWPPGEDFAEMLPSRFQDLMDVLPLAEYTHRNGRLNLASRLPDCFVRPDLGPKMYNAYGSALHPSKGTTNLHLDISDAVNVMVYVGIPKDSDNDEHVKEAFRAIDEAGCDILTRRRVRDKGELPGALWHIYNAKDADKIRDLLNKVVVEKGGRLEPHHDPIHDQSCYLDSPLRERLYKEYGVEGYAIVQCLGDAVFIPAGAPHQVRNLHNCIKVAEDFVSPENVSHCFHLTQEFRDLSDTHSNHEDKLQIKNIIYHTVKDSLSTLNAILDKKIESSKTKNKTNTNTDEVKIENVKNENDKEEENDATA